MMQVKEAGSTDREVIFEIRRKVFVVEQAVSPEDEYDEFEDSSVHFLAIQNNKPCGTARWRFTEKGIKLERFAVLKEFRGSGVGSALVGAVLDSIRKKADGGTLLYLHAQLPAIPLYAKFGFEKKGEMFSECAIDHYRMEKVV